MRQTLGRRMHPRPMRSSVELPKRYLAGYTKLRQILGNPWQTRDPCSHTGKSRFESHSAGASARLTNEKLCEITRLMLSRGLAGLREDGRGWRTGVQSPGSTVGGIPLYLHSDLRSRCRVQRLV